VETLKQVFLLKCKKNVFQVLVIFLVYGLIAVISWNWKTNENLKWQIYSQLGWSSQEKLKMYIFWVRQSYKGTLLFVKFSCKKLEKSIKVWRFQMCHSIPTRQKKGKMTPMVKDLSDYYFLTVNFNQLQKKVSYHVHTLEL
jgi:hypothetical protein